MRRWFILIMTVFAMCIPVKAQKYEAPPAPKPVEHIVPEEADSFAQGLWNVVRACIGEFHPALAQGAGVCLKVLAAVMLCGMITNFSGKETATGAARRGATAEGAKSGRIIGVVGSSTVRTAPHAGHFSSYQRVLAPHLSHLFVISRSMI